jgi:polysaccharide export outer membrane protein
MERLMKKRISQRAGQVLRWMGFLLLTGLLVIGCTSIEKPTFPDVPTDPGVTTAGPGKPGSGALAVLAENADRFAKGDLVTVKFSGNSQEILPHEERIKDDGTLTLPLIGAVEAAGKKPGELQKEIHDRYVPDYYKRLTVVVTGEQRVYSVGGQVKLPGRQSYIGATTVTKAIQSAGDFTDFAAKRRVKLTRADGTTITVDCKKAASDPSIDLPVFPGDKIDVPMRDLRDTFD